MSDASHSDEMSKRFGLKNSGSRVDTSDSDELCGGGVDNCDEVEPFSVVVFCLKYPSMGMRGFQLVVVLRKRNKFWGNRSLKRNLYDKLFNA